MTRRGRSGTPLSLFAFQDIITSVSGIFIVILLLLSLELTQRPLQHPASVSSNIAELNENIRQAESELSQLRKEMEGEDALTVELAANTPETLRSAINESEGVNESLSDEIRELTLQEQLLDEKYKALNAKREATRRAQEARDSLKHQVQSLETMLESEQQDARPIFVLPRGITKSGWLVEVVDRELRAAPLGRSAPPHEFHEEVGLLVRTSATDKFMSWIREDELKGSYFLLLIRPSGIDESERLRNELRTIGIEFGFDLIGQDAIVLHPSKGAGV